MRAWLRWDRLRDDPSAWVRTTAWHLCVDSWRSRRRLAGLLQRVRGQVEQLEYGPPIVETFNLLPPPLRQVATLYYSDDMSVEDIAQLLAIPVGTVKSRLSRSRELLRQQFSSQNPFQDRKD